MSVNVLPDMDEPRLRALGKQLNRNRKTSIIGVDKLKENLDVYVKSLNNAKKGLDGKYNVKSLRLKKNLARVRGTQKVLKARREQSFWEDSEDYPYGVYEGEKLDSYKREVDNIIEQRHPKYRRMKRVENQLSNGKSSGKILDNEDAKIQFEIIMSKERKNRCLHRENPLTKTFFHGARVNRIEEYLNNFCTKTTTKPEQENDTHRDDLTESNLAKHRSMLEKAKHQRIEALKCDSRSTFRGGKDSKSRKFESPTDSGVVTPSGHSAADPFDLESPPLRHLPPITAKKDFMTNKRKKEKTRVILPDLKIRRATKGDVTVGPKDSKKLDRLRNRRATSFVL